MQRGWLRRRGRTAWLAAVSLFGFGLLALGPAALVLGVREYVAWTAEQGAAERPPTGAEVRDDGVTFVVHTVRCGQVGPDRAVHGRLCEVTIGARNDGTQEVTVPGSMQKLAGPGGTRHLPLPDEPEPFGTMAPGQAATATLRFDLPRRAPISHIELQASPYTHGEDVELAGRPLPLLPADR